MIVFNPCYKCIVRACCTAICEPAMKWNRACTLIAEPYYLLEDLYKDREWVMLSLITLVVLFLLAAIPYLLMRVFT